MPGQEIVRDAIKTSWTLDQTIGRNLQINSNGSIGLLASSRGDAFNTQVTWII